jgi:hypothetical protein
MKLPTALPMIAMGKEHGFGDRSASQARKGANVDYLAKHRNYKADIEEAEKDPNLTKQRSPCTRRSACSATRTSMRRSR